MMNFIELKSIMFVVIYNFNGIVVQFESVGSHGNDRQRTARLDFIATGGVMSVSLTDCDQYSMKVMSVSHQKRQIS